MPRRVQPLIPSSKLPLRIVGRGRPAPRSGGPAVARSRDEDGAHEVHLVWVPAGVGVDDGEVSALPAEEARDEVGPVLAAECVAAAEVVGLGEAVVGVQPATGRAVLGDVIAAVGRRGVENHDRFAPRSPGPARRAQVVTRAGGRRCCCRSCRPSGRGRSWDRGARTARRRRAGRPQLSGGRCSRPAPRASGRPRVAGRGSAIDRDGRSHARGSGPAKPRSGDTGCRRRRGRRSPGTRPR